MHQLKPYRRNNLFADFDGGGSSAQSHSYSASPRPGGYGYSPDPYSSRSNSARNELFAGSANGNASKFRSATPNKKGQYSDAVLNELEGQNNEQFEGMSAKVQMLKQVRARVTSRDRLRTTNSEQ